MRRKYFSLKHGQPVHNISVKNELEISFICDLQVSPFSLFLCLFCFFMTSGKLLESC